MVKEAKEAFDGRSKQSRMRMLITLLGSLFNTIQAFHDLAVLSQDVSQTSSRSSN